MITREEYELLIGYRALGYKWIARDKNKMLYVYSRKPFKANSMRYTSDEETSYNYISYSCRNDAFKSITWEDEERTNINDLIRDYEAHQIITDETVKVTVPQYIADWIKEVRGLKRSFKLELLFDTTEMPDDVYDWLDERYGDTDILAKAWLDGYEVEKEKLYYIEFSENQYAQRFDGSNIDSILVNDKALAGRFTEEQIKKINPRFWLLTVEVE